MVMFYGVVFEEREIIEVKYFWDEIFQKVMHALISVLRYFDLIASL
jgi:hypothetical protein